MIASNQPNIKKIVSQVIKNHGTIAEAARVTGLSTSYLSRIKNDDLKPKTVKQDVFSKLLKGLTAKQRETVKKTADSGDVEFSHMSKEELQKRLEALGPAQLEALFTIVGMIPKR